MMGLDPESQGWADQIADNLAEVFLTQSMLAIIYRVYVSPIWLSWPSFM